MKDIQLSELLPNELSLSRLEKRWAVLVSRVIVKNLEEFKFLQTGVIWNLPHKYIEEMPEKSDMVIFFLFSVFWNLFVQNQIIGNQNRNRICININIPLCIMHCSLL